MARAWLLALPALLASGGTLAFSHHARAPESPPRVLAPAIVKGPAAANPGLAVAAAPSADSPFAHLPRLRFSNLNSRQSCDVQLYAPSGDIDELEAQRLDELLADVRDPKAPAQHAIDRRTLQLVVRAALHFGAHEVEVVSAYRKPGRRREGLHASGRAVDFKLLGVKARTLAAYLRTLPRVGVGIYTHPRTDYVHLDTREHSFHWLDASPPGRSYRELSIGGAHLPALDASYRPGSDYPEGLAPASARTASGR